MSGCVMLSNEGDLVGDEVPHIHVHLHNNAIDDATPVVESEQTIQDSLVAPALDLNEDQSQEEQNV